MIKNKAFLCAALVAAGGLAALSGRSEPPRSTSAARVASPVVRVDPSRISVAAKTPKLDAEDLPVLAKPAKVVSLTSESWQAVRSQVAAILRQQAGAMPSSIASAADLSTIGSKITVAMGAVPASSQLYVKSPAALEESSESGVLRVQPGSEILMSFPVTPGAGYFAACTLGVEVDYAFVYKPTGVTTARSEGHASVQYDGQNMMVWVAPTAIASSVAWLSLKPTGAGVFKGCDIVRVT